MIKRDDRKIYFYFSIITLIIGIVLGSISYYSILIYEPKVEKLLRVNDNANINYKNAYIMLSKPFVFARYDNFDRIARPIKVIIKDFDNKVKEGIEFNRDDLVYLELLLERRNLGVRLTRNTMIFFLLLSFMGWCFYIYELKQKSAVCK